MLTLSVIGVEDGAIIAVAPSGEHYRIPVDADLRGQLQAPPPAATERRLSPREIQSHVRAGLSAQQVSALTGAPVAYIERFVGPVIAEREYVTETARAVRLPAEVEGGRPKTFGAVMADRLASLAATGVRWTSTKETSGWIVALTFTADGIEHDARWRFEPKRMQLAPDNVEAATLSQQGTPPALTPRLRALEPTTPVAVIPPAEQPAAPAAPTAPDTSRFDSAVFAFPDVRGQQHDPDRQDRAPVEHSDGDRRPERSSGGGRRASGPTTDQLASLSRRRGEREPSIDTASLPVTRAMSVLDDGDEDPFVRRPPVERDTPAPVTRGRFPEKLPEEPAAEPEPAPPLRRPRSRSGTRSSGATPRATEESGPANAPPSRPRRGRTTMPSWDEIVFGRDED